MVTPELRNQAKIINYGLMYGMGASRLAQETGMKPPEAKKFIENYFRALPGVKRYLDASLQHAREHKEARTMFVRRRPLPEIDSTNAGQRIAAENMAVNTPIQGAAADIVKRAMLSVHAELAKRGLKARLLLQVHDELVLDVPEDELTEVKLIVRDCMRGAANLAVPLDVAIGTGPNWLDAHGRALLRAVSCRATASRRAGPSTPPRCSDRRGPAASPTAVRARRAQRPRPRRAPPRRPRLRSRLRARWIHRPRGDSRDRTRSSHPSS
jgi:hypothetical protein